MRTRATRQGLPKRARRRPSSSLRVAALTDRGPKGKVNEDAYAYVTSEASDYDPRINGSIFVLADGMGGHGGGDIASRITVQETIRAYASTPGDPGPSKRLHRAIVQANDRVLGEAAGGAGNSEMGSTVVACVISDGHMVIGHVGDSRAYLLRGGTLQQLTKDHLYVTDILGLSEDEASRHPQKNVLSRAVGRAGTEPDVKELTCQPGDRVLLCSDGVSNALKPAEMRNALARSGSKEAVMSIIDTARHRAKDNITAVVISVPGRTKPPPPRLAALLAAVAGGFLVLMLLVAMLVPNGPVNTPGNVELKNETGSVAKVRHLLSPFPGETITPGRTWTGAMGPLCLSINGEDYDLDPRSNLTLDKGGAWKKKAPKRSCVELRS